MKIDHYFSTIVGAQDGVRLKPNKDMIELVISKLKLKSYSYYMIGDTSNDVEAARSAGIKSIIVSGGYTDKAIKDINPDFFLNDMTELIGFLDV